MKLSWRKWHRGLAEGLALLAALAVSAFPGGLMPKVAGRCGRQLCNCEAEAYAEACKGCKPNSAPRAPAQLTLTLVNASISDSIGHGMAFHEVFSGVVAPNKFALPSASNAAEIGGPIGTAFALNCAASDLVVPPPRSECSL